MCVQSTEDKQYHRNMTHVKKYNDLTVSNEKDNDCVMLDDPIETPKPISYNAGDADTVYSPQSSTNSVKQRAYNY